MTHESMLAKRSLVRTPNPSPGRLPPYGISRDKGGYRGVSAAAQGLEQRGRAAARPSSLPSVETATASPEATVRGLRSRGCAAMSPRNLRRST